MISSLVELLVSAAIPAEHLGVVQRVLEQQVSSEEASVAFEIELRLLERWCEGWLNPFAPEVLNDALKGDESIELWKQVPDGSGLVVELVRELGPGHVLESWVESNEVRAIARRRDADDVLYFFLRTGQLAQVHLTWNQEFSPSWPHAMLYDGWEPWLRLRLQNLGNQGDGPAR